MVSCTHTQRGDRPKVTERKSFIGVEWFTIADIELFNLPLHSGCKTIDEHDGDCCSWIFIKRKYIRLKLIKLFH